MSRSDGETSWVRAFALEELPIGQSRLYKGERHKVAVFRLDEDSLHAVDNACPHEGYPLLGGPISQGVVTCPWHNYKFALADGRCIKGEEDVRSYPLRVAEGWIELDLQDPPRELQLAGLRRSLDDGVYRQNPGQIARDLVRGLGLGATPLELARICAELDAARAECGTGHGTAVAVDAALLCEELEGNDRALPLLYAYEMTAEGNRRLPVRALPEPPDLDPAELPGMGARLAGLVEEERGEEACALLLAALRSGARREDVERWFLRDCAAHLLSFGHALIYTSKVFELLDGPAWSRAPLLLPALQWRIVSGTRMSLLPEWSVARRGLGRWESRIEELWTGLDRDPGWDRETLLEALVGGEAQGIQDRLLQAFEAGAPLGALIDTLSIAASERLRRFDPNHERDVEVQDGWLEVTHRLTFVEAIRALARRVPEACVLRLLWQAATWIGQARPLDRADSGSCEPLVGSLRDLEAAMLAKDGDRAEACLLGALQAGESRADLRVRLVDLVLSGAAVHPIVSAHLIKTLVAAFAESDRLPSPDQDLPLRALVRFLAGPHVENGSVQRVHEAVRFVVEGKVPRLLS